MAGILDDKPFEFACPKCGDKIEITLGQFKTTDQHMCDCGAYIKLRTDESAKALEQVDDAVEKFWRTLERFGKRR
jgi:hypothetical protein